MATDVRLELRKVACPVPAAEPPSDPDVVILLVERAAEIVGWFGTAGNKGQVDLALILSQSCPQVMHGHILSGEARPTNRALRADYELRQILVHPVPVAGAPRGKDVG